MNVWSRRVLPWLAAIPVAAAGALLFAITVSAQTPVPTTPSGSVTPAPAGTPWPPPTGLELTGHSILLDSDNFPLPPDQQKHYRGISWAVLPGFSGVYEVQHATRPFGSPSFPLVWQPIASGPFPASSAVNGRIGFEELIPVADHFKAHCYRVRTVIDSAGGPETGPYSEPLCTIDPPSTGPGVNASVTPSVAPQPPDVGNTPLTASETGWLAAGAAVAGMVLLAAGAMSLRRR